MINIFISESCGSNGFKCPKSICFRAYTTSASCICRFGKLPGEPLQPDPDENPENAPEFCKCGCCVAMPTIGKQMLYTNKTALHNPSPLFPQLVLDGNVRSGPGHALQGRLFSVK